MAERLYNLAKYSLLLIYVPYLFIYTEVIVNVEYYMDFRYTR